MPEPRTLWAVRRRIDELNGFILGIKRDNTPAGRAEVAELYVALRYASRHRERAARYRLRKLLRSLARARRARMRAARG